MKPRSSRHASWRFREDEEIVPGRSVVQLLGGGERAEAWLAWDQLLHSLVVAKILRPDRVGQPSDLSAMEREARSLRELPHPAIVRLFDVALEGERPHLVLENLDGPRLSRLIRQFGPLSPEQLVPLGLEIGSALAYMHNRGFVHLDVKPRNLIMSATPKLIDLGMVRTLEELKRVRSPLGTRGYMAPEQCAVETLQLIGPPADVWGLGATLYEAATGNEPFPEEAGGPQHPQLTRRAAPLPPKVPRHISKLIDASLDPQPEGRPTAVELAAALEQHLEDSREAARRRLHARRR